MIKPKNLLCAAVLLTLPAFASQALAGDVSFSRGYTFEERDGKSIYENVCQGCHMADAKGATGAGRYPALAENPRLAGKMYPAILVLKGQGAMPVFGDVMDDEQIANVVNYVRSQFGNAYTDKLTPAEIAALRPPKKP
ncbi:MAG: cccA [Hydrocarboniphaga sp.]|uniref:c-type cytochrome n=1 Tax=Hydrocarboniphaga sp. TaxID=2033016 RepID=UPI002617F348|nr:cytochrome c [Hydrocarboniphaga sp.]MDB5972107.1 cccA [Hydrocarboniphaga sp.]